MKIWGNSFPLLEPVAKFKLLQLPAGSALFNHTLRNITPPMGDIADMLSAKCRPCCGFCLPTSYELPQSCLVQGDVGLHLQHTIDFSGQLASRAVGGMDSFCDIKGCSSPFFKCSLQPYQTQCSGSQKINILNLNSR